MKIWSSLDLLRLMKKLIPHGKDVPIRKFAKLFSISTGQLHEILRSKKRITKKFSMQLARLDNFLVELGDCMMLDSQLQWLAKPNKSFNHRRPIDMLRSDKGHKELMCMIDDVSRGAFM